MPTVKVVRTTVVKDGQTTTTVEVTTDGSVSPDDALKQADEFLKQTDSLDGHFSNLDAHMSRVFGHFSEIFSGWPFGPRKKPAINPNPNPNPNPTTPPEKK